MDLTNSPDYSIALINLTLQTRYFPNQFKHGVMRPLIQKSNFDPELLSCYHPVTRFLSKGVERVVLEEINFYLESNNQGAGIRVFFVARIQRKWLYWKSLMNSLLSGRVAFRELFWVRLVRSVWYNWPSVFIWDISQKDLFTICCVTVC